MSETEQRRDQHPTAVLLVLALSTFVIVVMQSLVLPILPSLADSLNVSTADASWVVTVNLLSAAVFTPILGSLGDALGRKRVLIVTLVLVTAGSVLAASSHVLNVVLAGRVLQGMGFAAMPLAIGIVRSIFPPHRVPSSLALLSALTGIGAGAGLLFSGILVNVGVSAQGMFWISAAATAVGLLGVVFLVRLPETASKFTVDVWGALTLAGGLVCVVLGINRGPSWGWGSGTVLGLFAGGVVLLAVWMFVETRVRVPLVDMTMMRNPIVLGTNLTAFLAGAGMFGAFVLVLQYVQTPSQFGYGFGSDALGAGLTLLPLTAGTLTAAVLVANLIRHVGPKWPLAIGMVVAAGTFAFMAAFHAEHWQFYVASGMLGLGLGLAMGSMPALLNTAVAPEKTSVANSINSTLRSVGGSIGTAIATAILASRTLPRLPLPTVDAYVLAFWVAGGICVLAVVAALLVPYRHGRATPNTRTVTGAVIGAAQPAPAVVTVTAHGADGSVVATTTADSDGGYRLDGVPAEPLTLVAAEHPAVNQEVTVRVGVDETLDINLGRTTS
ncbi:MFS transporter [Actinophytocola oryzae]|uniref:Carboxypeptidase family protein n=1 Tax=Actinophytocola oryzae TaxID=502181 RepID=A0A4R7VAM4_9PSEU|nr:MFS transporter [Actinophytocola oryzae]TDV46044.1 carboxypeptidase family protein [Actinophytocola oryzae]